ncbi:MAG: hypothetical protein EAZ53_13435 [Bacteroidetes bacterium]|nr:MAG: hypothetical protein EAZ53_13435 [Bacteroidota bacterium]
MYAGGNFTTVAGVERRSLAAIDAVSGSVTGWNPDANSIVFTLAISGSTVYAGGVFTNLFGGTGGWVGLAPAYIARLDTRINQTITGLSSAINVVYGAANQTLTGVAGSALPVVYVSSNTAVASVSGSVLAFVGAGNATITASNLGNNDYFPAQDVQIAVTVTPKSATISGANATRVYGEANPIFTGTVLGLVNGDAISFFGITAATSLSGIGTYPITATVMGANILNYQFSILNSVLTITKANLTVSADNFSRQYGLANPTFTGSITGAVNGDVITPSFNTTGLQTSNAGMYTISVIGINNGNYALITLQEPMAQQLM